jgi:hypothetical protein
MSETNAEQVAKEWKARRSNYEGNSGKPDDFVCADQGAVSPTKKKPASKKWNSEPTEDSAKRVDDWVGGSPDGAKPRRSWKVKSISNIPPPDVSDD